jgi:hypothetical protein
VRAPPRRHRRLLGRQRLRPGNTPPEVRSPPSASASGIRARSAPAARPPAGCLSTVRALSRSALIVGFRRLRPHHTSPLVTSTAPDVPVAALTPNLLQRPRAGVGATRRHRPRHLGPAHHHPRPHHRRTPQPRSMMTARQSTAVGNQAAGGLGQPLGTPLGHGPTSSSAWARASATATRRPVAHDQRATCLGSRQPPSPATGATLQSGPFVGPAGAARTGTAPAIGAEPGSSGRGRAGLRPSPG